jgi:hypothetical protein
MYQEILKLHGFTLLPGLSLLCIFEFFALNLLRDKLLFDLVLFPILQIVHISLDVIFLALLSLELRHNVLPVQIARLSFFCGLLELQLLLNLDLF